MYIHEHKNWPGFHWNQGAIEKLLDSLHNCQEFFMVKMNSLGFNLRTETVLQTITQDVVKTSEIEGEFLDKSLVRSSVARHLGIEAASLDKVDRTIEGVVEMMLDATQNYNMPLSKERLLAWHCSLFPYGLSGLSKISVGDWRQGPMQVVSGYIGKETVHFEAPAAEKINDEMTAFLNWFNAEIPLNMVVKAALAHLWFLTIHPFEDGNGRIARAIADLMLARSENSSQRFYSLSAQIQQERKTYYAILEQTQKGDLDITLWIEWFLKCLIDAIQGASDTLCRVLEKAQFWDLLAGIQLNSRQNKIINLLLDGFEGKLTSSKWAKIGKCSQDTAYRDILELLNLGILFKNPGGGRSVSYSFINRAKEYPYNDQV